MRRDVVGRFVVYMKRVIAIILIVMIIPLTGCRVQLVVEPSDSIEHHVDSRDDPDINTGQGADVLMFDGKIVIITNTFSLNEEAFLVAQAFAERFGEDRVIHKTWPTEGQEPIITETLQKVSEDPDVVALVLNNSLMGNWHIIDALENVRDDIFVVYAPVTHQWCVLNEVDVEIKADLIIQTNISRFSES